MYTTVDFKTKKALKDAVKSGMKVGVFAPGIGEPPRTGICTVEGPHYPKPHTWYARVEITEGVITKVS